MIETPPVKNILFAQDSFPCIRTIKYATALQAKGLYIHLAHRNKTPDEAFKFGNASLRNIDPAARILSPERCDDQASG